VMFLVAVGFWNFLGVIEWLRLPGDAYFILVGVVPLLYLCYVGVVTR
jgi:hypothetical protein